MSAERLKENLQRRQDDYDAAERAVENYFLAAQAFVKGGVEIDAKNNMNETALTLAPRAGAK
jgi:hypothetical protein